MFYTGWIGDAIKFLDFVNSPMGYKSVVRMLIVLNWDEPVYRIWNYNFLSVCFKETVSTRFKNVWLVVWF
jgi:hypothetical protein